MSTCGAQEIIHESERIFGKAQRLHESGGCIGRTQRAFLQRSVAPARKRLAVTRRQQKGSMRQVDSEALRHVRVRAPTARS